MADDAGSMTVDVVQEAAPQDVLLFADDALSALESEAASLAAVARDEAEMLLHAAGADTPETVALLPFLLAFLGLFAVLLGIRAVVPGSTGRIASVPAFALAIGLLTRSEGGDGGGPLRRALGELDECALCALGLLAVAFCHLMGGTFFPPAGQGGVPRLAKGAARQYPRSLPTGRRAAFSAMLPAVVDSVERSLRKSGDLPEDTIGYVRRLLEYNLPRGQLDRGILTLEVMAQFAQARGRSLSEAERCRGIAVGWSVEMLQAGFFVADDLMAVANTRRGQPCWYRLPDVAHNAVNDAQLLQGCALRLLEEHCEGLRCLALLREIFQDVATKTHLGCLVYLTRQSYTSPKDLSRFTPSRWKAIAKYRIAMYSVYLPIALGLAAHGCARRAAYEELEGICARMGEYIQAHEDFLSAYSDAKRPVVDIALSKCTWLIVRALGKAGMDQRRVLQQCYGEGDAKSVAAVLRVYRDLGLEADFKAYEEEEYRSIRRMIRASSLTELPRGLWDVVLSAVFSDRHHG